MVLQINALAVEKPRSVVLWSLHREVHRGQGLSADQQNIDSQSTNCWTRLTVDTSNRTYLLPESPSKTGCDVLQKSTASLGTMGRRTCRLPQGSASLSARIGVRQESLLFDAKKNC